MSLDWIFNRGAREAPYTRPRFQRTELTGDLPSRSFLSQNALFQRQVRENRATVASMHEDTVFPYQQWALDYEILNPNHTPAEAPVRRAIYLVPPENWDQ
jgi:hypothetical protein